MHWKGGQRFLVRHFYNDFTGLHVLIVLQIHKVCHDAHGYFRFCKQVYQIVAIMLQHEIRNILVTGLQVINPIGVSAKTGVFDEFRFADHGKHALRHGLGRGRQRDVAMIFGFVDIARRRQLG